MNGHYYAFLPQSGFVQPALSLYHRDLAIFKKGVECYERAGFLINSLLDNIVLMGVPVNKQANVRLQINIREIK